MCLSYSIEKLLDAVQYIFSSLLHFYLICVKFDRQFLNKIFSEFGLLVKYEGRFINKLQNTGLFCQFSKSEIDFSCT